MIELTNAKEGQVDDLILAALKPALKDAMKNSMQEMNVKLAVILERIDGHEKRLTRLEEKP